MRIVLDTSTLVAAIRSHTGAARAFVDLILAGQVTLLMNFPMACEYRSVALRPKHVTASQFQAASIVRLIEDLEDLAEPVEIQKSHRPLSPDPDDDLVLDLAINGRADAIIANNIRHLRESAARFRIPVLDARSALVTIREVR
jgi:putative PIN family toxin of toxin-antitoxin system